MLHSKSVDLNESHILHRGYAAVEISGCFEKMEELQSTSEWMLCEVWT
jgi:hypothetical protein